MTLKDKITSTPEGLRAWHRERVIQETTDLICCTMNRTGVSRAELAKRLQVTEKRVDKILDGFDGMSLGTVSDVFLALGREFHPWASPMAKPEDPSDA